ncbi:J domain-containing protein [Rhizobium hidalgonense]|uniref:J domain-containing protein n=1 Tax=Rhizobium hidalgonense TaxID=1538159 RepID=A0AAJ2GTZ7_9HYPH|nr:J domain-containing protein [Rhizobium hidalgonense]MDR9773094.1 J domain-containing protein [Rhizobium hidalgonense]MDR9810608.1 J domain-containing protein [Rhizobium hidalgonense]MDR9819236.1 J domain-containing protein [Rhizobium hidalgonense]
MTSDSKIFVGLRPTRNKPAEHRDTNGPRCQWDGCDKQGVHRAPVGADAEGLFLLFCRNHAKEYGEGYNYVTKLSNPVTARYQREAASGSRPSWGVRVDHSSETPLPSSIRSGTAKTLNARKSAAQSQAAKAAFQSRKLKVLEAKAFETLDLSPNATPDEIRSRYKQRLKMHHPDANDGDRTAESALQATIDAHKILKLNGFC